jgi:hypothetical protein
VRLFQRPPEGFDPLQAGDRELLVYGYPARPDEDRHPELHETWKRMVSRPLTIIEPQFALRTDKQHGIRNTIENDTSTNWSGAASFAAKGDSATYVIGQWTVPDVVAPGLGSYYCASWIGIDGDGSGDVCQIGVECEVYRSGSSITRNIYPWWEWFPEPEVQITNFAVSPGDMVTALLCAGPGAGATEATAYWTNRTTGDTTSLGFSAPDGTSLVGNSAEWIVEAPTVGGQQSALADYGEVFFSVCEAMLGTIGGGGTTVDGGTGDSINMNDSKGTEVSQANLITPTIIQCEYVGTLP